MMSKAERAAMVEARWAAEQAGNVAESERLGALLDADIDAQAANYKGRTVRKGVARMQRQW